MDIMVAISQHLILQKFSPQRRKQHYKLKDMISRSEETSQMAQKQAARFDILLPEDAG